MASKILDAALEYVEIYGFSVIPVRKDKRPIIKWEEYQKRKPTSDEVKAWFKRYPDANVGIVTGSISGLCVIDVDTADGRLEIAKLIPEMLEFPVCKTPGGGVHYYFRVPKKPMGNNTRLVPGCDFRGNGGYVVAPPSMNGAGKAYEWIAKLGENDLPVLPQEYIDYVSDASANSLNNALSYKTKTSTYNCNDDAKSTPLFAEGRRDNDLFHIANSLVRTNTPDNDIAKILKICIKSWGEDPNDKWVNDKIKSAKKRSDAKERNLTVEVTEWVLSSNGVFLSSNVVNCLQCRQRNQTQHISKILSRLVDDGIIERYGNKNGCFRRVEIEAPVIDYFSADEKPIDFKWPLGVEQYFNLMKKNVVIVAGEPDAGKSAYLLNVVKMNMDRYKIHYFSSEMGAGEMKSRMINFGIPLSSWKFVVKERAINFQDVIKPNDVNIIDYMEISDNFYQIGGWITAIFNKLQNGVAIIALQKPRGRDEGRGGEITKEKARLYLSMGHGKIKIVKAKNWVHPQINPKDLELNFKLVNGCDFIPQTVWQKPLK